MLLVSLILAAAAAAQLPQTQFGWTLPAAASLEVFKGRAQEFEQIGATDPIECRDPNARPILRTVPVPDTDYRLEFVWCSDQVVGESGSWATLFLRIARTGSEQAWILNAGDGVTRLGFDRLPLPWAEAETKPMALVPQPLVGALGPPAVVVVQFLTESSRVQAGRVWQFEQRLIDLRGAEPRQLALGVWTRAHDVRCGETAADGSGYRCDWLPDRADFVCVEKTPATQRTFVLSTGKPLEQVLSVATQSLDVAEIGALVHAPQLGLARVVARASASETIVLANTAHVVRKEKGGWRTLDLSSEAASFESTDDSPASVLKIKAGPGEQVFDVVRGGIQRLIRYRLDATPRVSELRAVDSPRSAEWGGACEKLIYPEILTVTPGPTGPSVLFQHAFLGDTFVDLGPQACPSRKIVGWGAMDLDDPETGACARPMVPLVSRIRPGRTDLLWADGFATSPNGLEAFSLRGSGRGTVVLLNHGLTAEQWQRIALGLSNNLEIVHIDAGADATQDAGAITKVLSAISSTHWALVAVGAALPDAKALEAAPSRPASTRHIPRALNKVLSDADVERVCGAIIQVAVKNNWITATERHPDQGCVRAMPKP